MESEVSKDISLYEGIFMEEIQFEGFDCALIENAALSMMITRSVGPRIISLSLNGGPNLLAVLPDFTTRRPDGKIFHFYGGHRLWHAPENMARTYTLDDSPVELVPTEDGVLARQPADGQTGMEKSMQIQLIADKPQAIIHHTLTNNGKLPMECAAWAITQFRTGGVAILPQSLAETGVLPNRSLALWPYTKIDNQNLCLGDRYILVSAEMQEAFKIGYPNPRGWLAYWLDGTLFVKRAAFDPLATYYDFGSSSECYCNGQFLELETLGPASQLAPGDSITHTETWDLISGIERPEDEAAIDRIVQNLELD